MRRRPIGSNWGEYGDDDQLGNLNLIDSRKVIEALAEVREGRTFTLSLPLDYPATGISTARAAPRIEPIKTRHGPRYDHLLAKGYSDVVNDDVVTLYPQYSTQWDAFCHIGGMFDGAGDGTEEASYYNGHRLMPPEGDDADAFCRCIAGRPLGIERVATHGVQGRGVLVDWFAHHGIAKQMITFDLLQQVMDRDNVQLERGDILCLRTGFAGLIRDAKGQVAFDDLRSLGAGLDGRDERLLQWISDTGIAAIAADNFSVEYLPSSPASGGGISSGLPLHEHCLFKNGILLGELWLLDDLANHLRSVGRSRFLLTAPPLALRGASGSPVTPIATV